VKAGFSIRVTGAGNDSRPLLSSMLEGVKAEEGDLGCLGMTEYTENTAVIARFVELGLGRDTSGDHRRAK